MVRKIAWGVLAVVVVFLGYVAMKSPEYVISREITINAPAEKIFAMMNTPKVADQWGPWKEIDPGTTMNHSGPEAGVGAKTSWAGGKQLGTGSATIVESVPNQKVGIKLEYSEPMVMMQDSEYLLKPAGTQTVVTWLVRGKNSFMGRLMCCFMNMDRHVGGMFEKGLSNLKAMAEKA